MLTKLSQRVLGNLTEDRGAQLAEALASLVKLSANTKDIRDLIDNLPYALQKVDSFERYYLTRIKYILLVRIYIVVRIYVFCYCFHGNMA